MAKGKGSLLGKIGAGISPLFALSRTEYSPNRAGWGKALGGVAGTAVGGLYGGLPGAALGGSVGAGSGDFIQNALNRNKTQSNQNGQNGRQANWWSGTPGGFEQVSPYTQAQQQLFHETGQQAFQGLQNPTAGFEPIRQRALSEFNQQTVPSLAERFTSMGQNRLSSPAFASQVGAAGSNLQEGLAALEAQYGLQNRQQLLQQLGLGLHPQYESYLLPPEGGVSGGFAELFQQAAPALGKLGGQALGSYLGAEKGQGYEATKSAVINGLKGIA